MEGSVLASANAFAPRAVITVILLVGVIYSVLFVQIFRRFGDALDDESRKKVREEWRHAEVEKDHQGRPAPQTTSSIAPKLQ